MIASFRYKGLKLLFEKDDPSRLNPEHVSRIRLILSTLDAAAVIEEMDQLTFRLHPLKRDLKDYWAVTVRANWRPYFNLRMDRCRMSISRIIIRSEPWL
jgi:proteic killer suppression protein